MPLPPEDCLFCRLVRDGDHVHAADGFVAIRDISPKAPTHLLILPEHHIDTFRDVGQLEADEAKRMAVGLLVVLAPLQIFLGDQHARFGRDSWP